MGNFKEKSEISHHLIKVWQFIKNKKTWTTHREIATETGVAERTVRAHTLYLVKAGLIDQAEVFPAHRYRYSEMGTKRNKTFSDRLEKAVTVFE